MLTRALTSETAFRRLVGLFAIMVAGTCVMLGVMVICAHADTGWLLPAALVGGGIGVRAIRRRG